MCNYYYIINLYACMYELNVCISSVLVVFFSLVKKKILIVSFCFLGDDTDFFFPSYFIPFRSFVILRQSKV